MRWHAAVAGLAASLVGIGLGRFAYTPLIPALIGAHWFPTSQVIYLGAANLARYLAGALAARRLAAATPAAGVLRGMMLLASASFFACAVPVAFAWYFVWRFAAGAAGGVIMVLAAPLVLPATDPARRGFVGGMIFTGVGLGVAASGTLVPLLLRGGLAATWCGLGALSLMLTVIAWGGWPMGSALPTGRAAGATTALTVPVSALLVGYGLNAAGLVPHMVFLVDFVARGLGAGLAVGGLYWVVFGAGAMAGPLVAGLLADRIGFGPALRLAFLIAATAVALPALTHSAPALVLSSAVVGALTPGIVPLVLGRVHDLLPGDLPAQHLAWGWTTIAFALCQAGSAYLYSFLFSRSGGGYAMLFGLGAAALGLALAIDFAVAMRHRIGSIA
jgi:predicted MFS family arabinose efflux permease